MDRDNKIYEINYLITPLVPEDKVVEEIAVFRKIIEDNKGFVVGEDQAKMQKLSYSIKNLIALIMAGSSFPPELNQLIT